MNIYDQVQLAVDRQRKILEMLIETKSLMVNDLAECFNVSRATIRRDLEIMEKERLLTRTHGGAVSFKLNNLFNISPQIDNLDEKRRIAAKAFAMIPEDSVICLVYRLINSMTNS